MTRGVFLLCKTKNQKHRRLKKALFVFFCAAALCVILFEAQAIPFTAKCVKKQSKTISTKIISQIVDEVQSQLDLSYDDLADIKYSDSGEVRSISADTVKINKFKSLVTRKIQNELDKQKLYKFSLPLGAFTDITLLSTLGPQTEISFYLTGSVNCKIKSKFESGGVNQTIHHIYLIVNTDIITISPEYKEQCSFSTDYEIAQTVIVGNIPSTYADIVR